MEWMRSGGSSVGVPAAGKDMEFVLLSREPESKPSVSGYDSEKEEQWNG